jgi:Protein of unknown function (DUF2865)
MTDPKQSPKSGGLSLYFIFSMACGAVLALASVAFRADGEIAGRLHAKGLTGSDKIAAVHATEHSAAVTSSAFRGDGVAGRLQTSPADQKLDVPVLPPVRVIAHVADTVNTAASEARPSLPVGSDEDELASATPWAPPKGQTYRTVCVRLCDGAMTPVSFSTRRSRFLVDAERCAQQCGSPSMLFVYPTTGAQDDMVDLEGRAYRDLPTAYKFRTDYDAACGCRAQPWETVALDRHRAWALAHPEMPAEVKITESPTIAQVDVPVPAGRVAREVVTPVVVAALEPGPRQPPKSTTEAVKPAQSVIGASATTPKLTEGVAAPRPKPKSQKTRVAVADPAPVAPAPVPKKRVGIANKVNTAKAAPAEVVVVRRVVKPVQGPSLQVAEMVSHRKTGIQRSFQGDDWRISVWVPR